MTPLRDLSLRTKIALAVSTLFIIAAGVIAVWALALFETEKKASLSSEAFDVVAALADNVDTKLQMVHRTLIAVAATVPPRALEDYEFSEDFLSRQVALHTLFDNGLFLVRVDGKLIGESPPRPARRGSDVSAREYFHKTIETRKPYISKPYRSTHNPGAPALIMTVPVFNSTGQMIGLLYGSLDLRGSNVLADLAKVRLGRTGFAFLADGRDTMIVHPDPSRIMKPLPRPGQNLLFDRAVNGWEGVGETVNSSGVEMLFSARHLKSTGWIIGANLPIAEFYAPIREARRYLLLSIALGTLVFLVLVWFLTHRLLSPLSTITRQVEGVVSASSPDTRLTARSKDEIGILAAAFNQMLERLARLNAELEQRVRDRTTQLETANKELEAFAYSVSHDLRAPLRAVDGFSQALIEDYAVLLDDAGRNYLRRIRSGAQHMGTLIDDMLRLSRIMRMPLQPTEVDLTQLARIIASDLQHSQPERNVSVHIADGLRCHGDPGLLRIVLENLLGNAWKYTSKNAAAHISFEAEQRGGETVYYVRDDGVGFDMKFADKLFGAFQRLHRRDEFEGTGIGLATVARIVHRHGGRVWAEAKLGHGANFYFALGKTAFPA